jgi:hypothetical protein
LLWLIVSDAVLAVFEPEAVAVHLKDVDVMGEEIEQRAGLAVLFQPGTTGPTETKRRELSKSKPRNSNSRRERSR